VVRSWFVFAVCSSAHCHCAHCHCSSQQQLEALNRSKQQTFHKNAQRNSNQPPQSAHPPRAERVDPPEQRQQPQVDRAVHRAVVRHDARRERVVPPVHQGLDRGAQVAQRERTRLRGVPLRRDGDAGVEGDDAPERGVLGGEALLLGVEARRGEGGEAPPGRGGCCC